MDLAIIDSVISNKSLAGFVSRMVDIPSPTGEESVLAKDLIQSMREIGIEANEQVLTNTQSNALGVLKGRSNNEGFLLYAPIDTVTCNNEKEDLPWVGDALRDDMRATSLLKDGHVYGLGAHNPKGHGACILEAARVLAELKIDLKTDVYFGFGAGGMPTHSRDGFAKDTGHGIGCSHMLKHMPLPSAAIIAKSGWSVSSEEVGFIWMDVEVEGIHTYVGSRHLLEYDNAIVNASKLVIELEKWFEKRSKLHRTNLINPQAVVSFIESGWERMPAFTPAKARFRVDLRIGPDDGVNEAEQEFTDQVANLADQLKIQAACHRVMYINPSRTNPDELVIRNAIDAWEAITQTQHQPFSQMSGATDANILRQFGIPTARVGLPKVRLPELDFQLGMNCVSIEDMRNLTKLLVLTTLKMST